MQDNLSKFPPEEKLLYKIQTSLKRKTFAIFLEQINILTKTELCFDHFD